MYVAIFLLALYAVAGDAWYRGSYTGNRYGHRYGYRHSFGRCFLDQFKCNSGTPRCITKSHRCDGHRDCSDGSDEWYYYANCRALRPCSKNQFKCRTGTPRCVPKLFQCDGNRDCSDGSDEWRFFAKCHRKTQITTVTTTTTTTPTPIVITDHVTLSPIQVSMKPHLSQHECYSCIDLVNNDWSNSSTEVFNRAKAAYKMAGIPSCDKPVLKACPSVAGIKPIMSQLKKQLGKTSSGKAIVKILDDFVKGGVKIMCSSMTITINSNVSTLTSSARGCQAVPINTRPGCQTEGPLMEFLRQVTNWGFLKGFGTSTNVFGEICVCDGQSCCDKGLVPVGNQCKINKQDNITTVEPIK